MLYPVLNKVLDLGEIRAALTKGIKVSAQVAYAIEQQMPQSGHSVIGDNTGYEPPRPTKLIQGQDGKVLTLEQFLTGGEALSLQAGQTFKIVQSQNPHENVSDYMKEIERDIVACGDWPYEVVRNIVDLGGANTRFVLADCQSKIEEEQDALLDQFGTAFYHRQTRDLIEAGELNDVPDWDRAAWTFPARLTVDFGRDGKLHIERYKRGMVTMKSLYGYTGDEWKPEVDQFLDERQYIVQAVINRKITDHDGTVRPMTMIEAYPEIQPAPAAAAAAPEPDPAEEDVVKPPMKKAA
jgi:hypothetical protein